MPSLGEAGTGTSPPLISPVLQFRNIEGITTAILDEFPALRDWRRKTAFLGALCTSFYLLGLLLVTQVWGPLHPHPAAPSTLGAMPGWRMGNGLPSPPISAQALRWEDGGLCVGPGIDDVHGVGCPAPTPLPQAMLILSLTTSQGGIFWFTLIDTYSTGFGLLIVALFMCLGIAFCYGERSGWPRGMLQPALGGAWWGAASTAVRCCQPWGTAAGCLRHRAAPGYHTGKAWHSWGSRQTVARLCRVHLQLWTAWSWGGQGVTPVLLPTRSSALQGDGAKPRCNFP